MVMVGMVMLDIAWRISSVDLNGVDEVCPSAIYGCMIYQMDIIQTCGDVAGKRRLAGAIMMVISVMVALLSKVFCRLGKIRGPGVLTLCIWVDPDTQPDMVQL